MDFRYIPNQLGIKDPTRLLKLMPRQSEYFTPAPEDFRIGYDCEIWWNQNFYPENGWVRVKILEGDTKDFDLADFTERIPKNEIRVPYLTKEQIEAEGWEITGRELKPAPYKVDWINAKKGEHTLWINLALHDKMHLGISDKIYNVFRGQCKDINTFRYICKLLNI